MPITITPMTQATPMTDGPAEALSETVGETVSYPLTEACDREAMPIATTSYLPLMTWLSPAFPVGSFAYSHGLEWVVEAGVIHNFATATAWLADLVSHGGLRNDAILLAAAWQAANRPAPDALRTVNDLALALCGSRERYLETTAQGNAFRIAIASAWVPPSLVDMQINGDTAYPVAVAVAAAQHGMELGIVLEAFGMATVGNLTSALVRLNAIGQSDGQRVLAAVLPTVRRLAVQARSATLDDVGTCAFRSDIASLRHETQYTRVFRT